MTCLAGIKEGSKIYIGADSLITYNDLTNLVAEEKIFRVGKALIGASGDWADIQVLRHNLKLPKKPKSMTSDCYMQTKFVKAVRDCLEKNGRLKWENNVSSFESTLLIAFEGELYKMDCCFSILKSQTNYNSIGSGMYYALGALYATENLNLDPETRIIKALESAERWSTGVRAPFIVKKA